MAGKKPATKVRKPAKAAPKSGGRKPVTHHAAARKPAAAQRKTAPAKPAREAARPAREPARASREAARPAREPARTARKPAPAEIIEIRRPAPVALPPSRALDGDEGETTEPGSLLAGPRNVKPYIAKRGEQYMGKEQLAHFQQILASWKRDLMEEVDRTVSHMKDEAANFPDPNDRATQEEEFSLELRTRDRERKLIRKIDEALKRIEDGTYGYCLETGEEIGIKRLEARPVATLSLEAQERRERRERQYGDRDDRYR
jgi:DnaK suppressor protein